MVGAIEDIGELHTFVSTGIVVDHHRRKTAMSDFGGSLQDGARPASLKTAEDAASRLRQRFVVRDENGGDREEEFDGLSVGLREGHRVSIVRARHRRGDGGLPVAVINHTTGISQTFPGQFNQLIAQRPLVGGFEIALVLCLPILFILAASMATGAFGAWPAAFGLAFAIGVIAVRNALSSSLANQIQQCVDAQVRHAIAAERAASQRHARPQPDR